MSVHPYETIVAARRNAAEGFDSIGAVATQKMASDSLNLGFPSAYESVVALGRAPRTRPAYLEMGSFRPFSLWEGNDLQSQVHQQRKKDADYMAKAKVIATQRGRVRYASTPHGRGEQPKAVLSQRKFANPSMGALTTTSGRRDQMGSPYYITSGLGGAGEYSGGVVRTPAGRNYVASLLTKRIGELDAIQQQSQGIVPGSMAPPSGDVQSESQTNAINTDQVNGSTGIELNLLLSIINACMGGDAGGEALTRFTVSDATRALLIIFRLAPTAPPDFEEDLMGKIDQILSLLSGVLDPDVDSPNERVEARENALSLQILFTKLREYLQKMIDGRNLLPRERVALSKALVADLGFSKMLKSNSTRANLESQFRSGQMNPQESQTYRSGDMGGDDNDDDEFDESAAPREDNQHRRETGVERGDRDDFDEDGRDAYGEQRGPRGTLGIFPSYYGEPPEAEDEEAEAPAPRLGSVMAKMATSAVPAPTLALASPPAVRGRYDEDTQGFNIEPRASPRRAPTVSSSRAPTVSSSETEESASSVSTTPSAKMRRAKYIEPNTASKPVMTALGLRNYSGALPRANERGAAQTIESVISALEAKGLVNIRAAGTKNRKAALVRQMKGKGLWLA